MKKRRISTILLVASGLVLFTLSIPFQAHSDVFPEDGKIIRFIVVTAAGGGMDADCRNLAPFLKKYLPWKKGEVVVENVTGAGGITGSRTLFMSKPDGYTIGHSYTRLMLFPQLLGQIAKFDITKFTFLGQFSNYSSILWTRADHPFLKSFEDMKNPPRTITFALPSTGEIGTFFVLKENMKLNVKPIMGYKGTKESQLALLQGEVDTTTGEYGATTSLRKSGQIQHILHWMDKPLSMAPEIPSLKDLGYEEYAGKLSMDRNILGPPDIPKERVEILRTAIWKALNDPEFQERAKKAERYLDVQDGEATREISLKLINFWTKYGDQVKQTFQELGIR